MPISTVSSIQQAATHPLMFLSENWAWFAPLVYVYVSLVGMVQSWLQFRAFGLNVFDFSEINDFLLAAFREPTSLLVVLGLLAYGVIGVLLGAYFRRKRASAAPDSHVSKIQRLFNYIMLLLVVVAPFYGPLLLDRAGKGDFRNRVLHDPARLISLQVKDLVETSLAKDGWIRDVRLIGMSGKYLFLHIDKERVLIVPTANVIALIAPPSRTGSGAAAPASSSPSASPAVSSAK